MSHPNKFLDELYQVQGLKPDYFFFRADNVAWQQSHDPFPLDVEIVYLCQTQIPIC